MAVLGLRGTGDWGTDERPKNFREMILWRDPNGSAPLTALMAKARSQSTDDPEYSWWEEELKAIRLQVNGVRTSGETAIIVDNGDARDLKAGDLLLVETAEDVGYTAEIMEVSADPTVATSVTVTRGAAGTVAAGIADNTFLTKIGSAYAEGTGAPKATTRNPTKFNNFTEIFKDVYEITGTAEQTRLRTGDPVKNDKKRKMFDHSVALEYAFLFGKKFETTGANGKPKRYTGGLLHFLAQAHAAGNTHCMKIWSTAPTEDTFLDAVFPVFDYNTGGVGSGNQRLVLCGNGFLNKLNKLAKNSSSTRINFDSVVKVFGMELQRWILPQGTLLVRTHPLMNTHSRYTNSAFVLNPGAIVYRPMKGRDTKPKDNIQGNDEDSRKGMWQTEVGLEPHHLLTMQYHGNFNVV